MLDTFSTLFLPPQKRGCELCQPLSIVLLFSWSSNMLSSSFLFRATSRHPECAGFHQCSQTGETEASPLAALESQDIGCMIQSSLSLPQRSQELGVCSRLHSTVLGRETMARDCYKFSYGLQCNWFHTCLGCRSLLTGFWISQSGNWSIYC